MTKDNTTSRRTVLGTITAAAFGLGTVGTAAASPETVSVGDARAAAAATVERATDRKQFAAWEGASLGQPTTFHARNAGRGPAAVPSVYVFPVQKRGDDLGYVTAGARPEWADVIEYSTASPPQRHVTATRARARSHGARPTDRLLYHGGVKYGVELADGRGVNVRNGRPAPLTEIDPSRVAARPEGVTTGDDTAGTTAVTTDSYYDWLWEVPAWTESDTDDPWDDWDGCVPVAASMILAYHEDVGEYMKEVYIDDLHVDMNTNDAGSTFPTDIDNGINQFDTGDNSYNGRNIYLWSHPNFTKQEIGAGRPFLLNMTSGDQADDRNQNYGNHTVAVVGYDEGGDELILHDTWDDTTHHFDWGSWLAASYTKITVE